MLKLLPFGNSIPLYYWKCRYLVVLKKCFNGYLAVKKPFVQRISNASSKNLNA